jgi:zinc transporter
VDRTDSGYGSDQHGVVWAYRFVPGQSPAPVTGDEVTLAMQSPGASELSSYYWIHVSLANAACEKWLRRTFALPDVFYHSLTEQVASTRLEQDDDTLIAVLHDAAFDFTFDPESVATVHLCLTPRLLLTVRLRPVRSVDRLRTAVRSGVFFRSTADLLSHLLRHQADVLTEIVRDAARAVDGIEDKLLADRVAASRRELGTLRRTLVRLQRLLAPEPAALFRILSRAPVWLGAEDMQDLRQAAEEFSATTADCGALVERVKLLQEELAALVGEQTNRTLFVLTLVTVLALPINLVAGLFGMNVGGIPLSAHRSGFLVIVGVLAVFTLVVGYFVVWRRRE